MKGIYAAMIFAVGAFVLASCAEKKKTNDIIAPKPVVKAPAAPVKMQPYNHSEQVEWMGGKYTVDVKRSVDGESPVFSDESNNKYYDNKVLLAVARPDGTEFFRREFTKHSFSQVVDESYIGKSTVLGVVLDHAEGDNLIFVASVGSPDQLSDDFIPITLTLSKTGVLSMKKGQNIGTSDNPNADEEEGV